MRIEERVEKVLAKLKLQPFYPFPFARSGFWQTIYGAYWPILKPSKPDFYHHVVLPDGDILVVAENRPKTWQPGQRIMLLVHGLGGSHQATYMQRMCRRMNRKGFLVLRLNLRFCGPGRGLAKRPYHCGASEDTRHLLEWAKIKFPGSPVTQIGFSLGGNLTLKMAAESAGRQAGNLDSAVSISAPLDLASAAQRFNLPENRFFQRIFVKALCDDLQLMRRLDASLPDLRYSPDLTIGQFDKELVPPLHGFKDVDDYYKQCSAINHIPEIKMPTLILSAMDDPISDGHVVRQVPQLKNLDVILTRHGGHVGFLGFGTSYDEVRWSDQAVARWLEDTLAI